MLLILSQEKNYFMKIYKIFKYFIFIKIEIYIYTYIYKYFF